MAVFTGPVEVVVHPHALAYVAHVDDAVVWTGLYIVAVIGAPLRSGYRHLSDQDRMHGRPRVPVGLSSD